MAVCCADASEEETVQKLELNLFASFCSAKSLVFFDRIQHLGLRAVRTLSLRETTSGCMLESLDDQVICRKAIECLTDARVRSLSRGASRPPLLLSRSSAGRHPKCPQPNTESRIDFNAAVFFLCQGHDPCLPNSEPRLSAATRSGSLSVLHLVSLEGYLSSLALSMSLVPYTALQPAFEHKPSCRSVLR
ncbi:hypothetical protein VTK26DRAFT_6017 [Humicola hyalothermophila]